MSDTRVAVVGGGFAGLFCGVALALRGVDVVVLEQDERPGGVAGSIDVEGHRLEPGASTVLLPNPALDPLLEVAGVAMIPAAAARRFIFDGEKMIEIPTGLKGLAAPVVSWPAKLQALAEPLRSHTRVEPSLAGFFRQRFGEEAGNMAAGVIAAGLCAGDAERLSAASVVPRLTEMVAREGSVFRAAVRASARTSSERPRGHVPAGGMRRMAEALSGWLGERFRAAYRVEGAQLESGKWVIEGPETVRADQVVMTVAPSVAAELVGDGHLAAALRRAVTAPVTVVFLSGPESGFEIPEAFGYLAAPDADAVGVGCLFESRLDPGRAPEGRTLVKVIAGGARHPEISNWDDRRLVEVVGSEVARALGCDVTVDLTTVVRHHPGIPQYEVGHEDWLASLDRRLLDLPGLHLGGWGYRGIGLTHLAADANRIAARISSNSG